MINIDVILVISKLKNLLKKSNSYFLQVAELLKVLQIHQSQKEDDDVIECNNMTLINLVLKIIGPVHERTLTVIMLMIQV